MKLMELIKHHPDEVLMSVEGDKVFVRGGEGGTENSCPSQITHFVSPSEIHD